MAFKNAEQLNDKLTEKIAGGMSITNDFGDYKTYKIGYTKDNYLYTFPASSYVTVVNIALDVAKANPRADEATLNKLLMDALLDVPGLLTPIA